MRAITLCTLLPSQVDPSTPFGLPRAINYRNERQIVQVESQRHLKLFAERSLSRGQCHDGKNRRTRLSSCGSFKEDIRSAFN